MEASTPTDYNDDDTSPKEFQEILNFCVELLNVLRQVGKRIGTAGSNQPRGAHHEQAPANQRHRRADHPRLT